MRQAVRGPIAIPVLPPAATSVHLQGLHRHIAYRLPDGMHNLPATAEYSGCPGAVINHYNADPGALEWLDRETDKTLRVYRIVSRIIYNDQRNRPGNHTRMTFSGLPVWMQNRYRSLNVSYRSSFFNFRLDGEHPTHVNVDAWSPRKNKRSHFRTHGGDWPLPPLESWEPEDI
jgi:hypothetical protein